MTYSAHFTLQGKGGVGKSFVAATMAQFLGENGYPLKCYDTDPTNATFFGYKALNVQRLELLEPGSSVVVERKFDGMVETIAQADSNYVIDNGATSFLPFTNYMLENDVIPVLSDAGVKVVIHTIITGGQALADTLNGFDALASQLPPAADLVVWQNEFFGEISIKGKPFEESNLYKQHKARVHGVVRIPRQTSSTFGADVAAMLDARLTYDEVKNSEAFGMMAKSRLLRVKVHLFEQLAHIVSGGRNG